MDDTLLLNAEMISSLKKRHNFLFEVAVMSMSEGIDEGNSRSNKVVVFKHPIELKQEFDLEIKEPTSDDRLISICKDVIKFSVKTGHPYFFNQLYGGLDEYSLGGSWLTEVLNTSLFTYEVAPVFTIFEEYVVQKMLGLAGFVDGDGIFCPGGSISNMYAINIARNERFPEIKEKGMNQMPKLCILTSDKAHFSIKKGAALLGLGTDNVIPIDTDEKGRMLPQALSDKIQECDLKNIVPFFVNATSGTTVLGAFDPLEEISNICRANGLWLHVDGAWGGAVLLSKKHKTLMNGIDKADSFTWNPHKMMGANYQASAFLTKHKSALLNCHSAKASYLFQQDKCYDINYDTGDKSVQCGRKVDAFKVWTMWKAKGDDKMEAEVDHLFDCSRYLAELVRSKQGFRLLQEPECTNVCFWYIPKRLQNCDKSCEWWEEINKVAPAIKKKMVEQGTVLIGYQPDGKHVNFFRMVLSNVAVTYHDMEFVLNEIQRLGDEL